MALSSTVSNHMKYALAKKLLELSTDTIKILLMRTDFVFNKDTHAILANIKGTSGAISLTFNNTAKTIVRGSGSFIDAGFVVGNKITTDSANNPGPFYITTIAALTITCSAATFINETVTQTVTADDELATGNGYTQNTKTLGSVVVTEDDANDRMQFTCGNVDWTASGGDIGPTAGALLYDDTPTENTILGYLSFGENYTLTDTGLLRLTGIILNLN